MNGELCRDTHHNWICTLDLGHDGPHADRSLVDGFVYLTWPNLADAEAATS